MQLNKLIMNRAAAKIFGRAKGNRSRKVPPLLMPLSPFRSGGTCNGFAKAPPSAGPSTLPMFHTRGIILKARGCNSFQGTNSATAVRITPTFPFPAPPIARTTTAIGNEVEKPQSSVVTKVLKSERRIVGLRPKRSLACPQAMPVKHWARLNTLIASPAHLATEAEGTKKDIISGRYGFTLVSAIGSAKRHIAKGCN